jgi:flagella basal body P-ring formation protein FlgA
MIVLLSMMMLIVGNGPTTVTSDDIKSEINEYVMEHNQESPDSIIVEYRNLPDSIVLPARLRSMSVIEPHTESLKGNVNIPVKLVCVNNYEQTILASVKVRRFAYTIVTTQKKDRHMLMYQGDVRIVMREITRLPDDLMRSTERLDGKRTRRILLEGTTLCESMFEDVPAVDSGDEVILYLKSGNVTLSTKAVARESGRIGEMITVEKSGKRDRVKGKVISSKMVAVDSE